MVGKMTEGDVKLPAVALCDEPVGDAHRPESGEQQPHPVQPAGGALVRPCPWAACGRRARRSTIADRDVDQEDGVPADALQEEPAERRTEDGGQDDEPPRSRSSAWAGPSRSVELTRIVSPVGASMPPPRPCRARKAMSSSADVSLGRTGLSRW